MSESTTIIAKRYEISDSELVTYLSDGKYSNVGENEMNEFQQFIYKNLKLINRKLNRSADAG